MKQTKNTLTQSQFEKLIEELNVKIRKKTIRQKTFENKKKYSHKDRRDNKIN